MTRQQLIERVRNAKVMSSKRLNHCQAWTELVMDSETGELYLRLRSYNTIVACIVDSPDGCQMCIVFDYWSSTTSQHISKFMRQNNAKQVLYLYIRSDRIWYEQRMKGNWDIEKFHSKKIIDIVNSEDWETIIDSYTNMWGRY